MTRPVPSLRATDGGTQLWWTASRRCCSAASCTTRRPPTPSTCAGWSTTWRTCTPARSSAAPAGRRSNRSRGRSTSRSVDAQLAAARDRGLHLVLIWFGAFKNAASTYAPRWVRSDPGRFPRAVVDKVSTEAFSYPGAMPKPVLSVFSPELLAADRAAFVALMRHLAEADPEHVVVMVQVENEVGLLGDSRTAPRGRRGLAAGGAEGADRPPGAARRPAAPGARGAVGTERPAYDRHVGRGLRRRLGGRGGLHGLGLREPRRGAGGGR